MEEINDLKEELRRWQDEVTLAKDYKTQLLLNKQDADKLKKETLDELLKLREEECEIICKHATRKAAYDEEMNTLNEKKSELKKEILRFQKEMQAVMMKCKGTSEKMKIQKHFPERKVKFSNMEVAEEDLKNENYMKICCQFNVATKIPFELKGGQALVTFEEEEVAQNFIKKQRHIVNLDTEKIEVTSLPVPLTTGLKFEIHVDISRRDMCVSGLPDYIPEECLRDKLELHFYKSKIGGGEINNVKINKDSKTSIITFLDPGVAQHVVKRRKHTLWSSSNSYEVTVAPLFEARLEKLQTYAGISRRTILLTNIRNPGEEEEYTKDLVEIFFQKPSNGGGEIQAIKYLSDGTMTAYFEEDCTTAEQN